MLKNKEIVYLVVNMKHGLVQDYFNNYNDAADCCDHYNETFPDGFKVVHLFEASEYEK